ncbi:MAG: tRNA pseudouridine(38-40) synthase TruA [Oligoflexia bacterium]|nr:tRNA pseudouridine(38-40) synthase TruA [Oligoflexia bacterium]
MIYKLVISYVGTAYYGWQVQKDLPTVQGNVEALLEKVFKQKISLRYSSRTDTGVHALGQVASFHGDKEWKPSALKMALNTQLPPDIVVRSVEIMPDDFDARRASKKTYYYLINNTSTRNPFGLDRVWWVKQRLDIQKMRKAIEYLRGERDFSGFMGSGSDIKTTIRTIYQMELTEKNGYIRLTVTAGGFLKQMVRNITGTLVDIGRGRFSPEYIREILASGDRKKAGVAAPACGLYLEKVYYDE